VDADAFIFQQQVADADNGSMGFFIFHGDDYSSPRIKYGAGSGLSHIVSIVIPGLTRNPGGVRT
jgi:hypothetical protein